MSDANYRFYPWVRRGLSAAVAAQDGPTATLPARPAVTAGITVSAQFTESRTLRLYGPGDVIGIDPQLIIRTDPRSDQTNVEPNYCPAIEFDPPEFPWVFTPAKPGANDQLRPWCVLVVLDTDKVGPPQVDRTRPLPTVTVKSADVPTELPDLRESAFWAHAQYVPREGANPDPNRDWQANPSDNLSRMICPRRLEPNKTYQACLVPAFGVGVTRGLGGRPAADATLTPAWDVNVPAEIRLPVYYHWTFTTGPAGDFEALARRLKPRKPRPEEDLGRAPTHVVTGADGLPLLPAAVNTPLLKMEGAVDAGQSPSQRSEVAAPLQATLRDVLNAANRVAPGAPEPASAFGPPIYGQWFRHQHQLTDTTPAWLLDLNLDPRMRAAAGLGAELVREYQEALMQACWTQVGKILDAQHRLNWGRLAVVLAVKLIDKHIRVMPADRLMLLAGPLLTRAKLDALTIRARIHQSSMPDAAVSGTFRRQLSPQRPALQAVARRLNPALAPGSGSRSELFAGLADGRLVQDPLRATPDGVTAARQVEAQAIPADARAKVNLASLGLAIEVEAGKLQTIKTSAEQIRGLTGPVIARPRTDLAELGLFTEDVLKTLDVAERPPFDPEKRFDLPSRVVEVFRERLRLNPTFLTLVAPAAPVTPTGPGTVAGEPAAVRRTRDILGILADRGASAVPAGTVVRPPVKDATTLNRFKTAFEDLDRLTGAAQPAVTMKLVAFPVDTAQAAVLNRLNPLTTVARRVRGQLGAGRQLNPADPNYTGVLYPDNLTPPMAYPEIEKPVYEYLAVYDKSRFIPGVEKVEPDSVLILETNPRFIEAILIGINHEMNRELLWRRFPTDQRGTPFQRFWAWLDGKPDIPPLHRWRDSNALGSHARGAGGQGQLIVLFRGELFRRYPNAAVYLWKAQSETKLIPNPTAADLIRPAFAGRFDPDFSFVGFDTPLATLRQGAGWFVILQEQPTEPRFGLDEPANDDRHATNPTAWSGVPMRHNHLDFTAAPQPFGRHAGEAARKLLQMPFRVAIHTKHLVT